MPLDEVAARELRPWDVIRLDDPQAHRVVRAVVIEGRVVLELWRIGLDIPGAARVMLLADTVVDRLGTAED